VNLLEELLERDLNQERRRLGDSFYDKCRTAVQHWSMDLAVITGSNAIHELVQSTGMDALNCITSCEGHGGVSYRTAVMPPMPTFEQMDELAVVHPEVAVHTIRESLEALVVLKDQAERERSHIRAQQLALEQIRASTIQVHAHDPRQDDMADAVSYAMNSIFQGTGIMRVNWSEPGDPQRWPDGLPVGDAGVSEQVAADAHAQHNAIAGGLITNITAATRIDQDPVADEDVDEAQQRRSSWLADWVSRVAELSPLEIFGRRTLDQQRELLDHSRDVYRMERTMFARPGLPQHITSAPILGPVTNCPCTSCDAARQQGLSDRPRPQNPSMSPREAKLLELMSSNTPPTWRELRRLAEDGLHPASIMAICRRHHMEYLEPTAQLRQESDDQVDDELELEGEDLGVDTDDMLGMGEAETWFREHTEESP